MRTAIVVTFGLLGTLAASPAHADDKKACDAAYDQAQTLRDAKKLTAARDQLRVCARSTCPSSMVKDCTSWLADADARIPSVVVVANDATGSFVANVSVAIDGGAPRKVDGTAWEVDPGPHALVFATPAGTKVEKSVMVLEGQKAQRVAVTMGATPAVVAAPALVPAAPPPLDAAPSPPASPSASPAQVASDSQSPGHGRRVLGIAVGGAGLAGVVVGGIFGGLTFSAWSSSKSACPMHTGCSQAAVDDHNHAVTFGTVSDIGLIAGGVLVAAGVTLYLTAPKDGSPSVGLQVLPGGLAVAGRF